MQYKIKLFSQLLIHTDIKAVKYVPADDRKKGRSRRKENFSIFVYNMLKQLHPDTGIASKDMTMI